MNQEIPQPKHKRPYVVKDDRYVVFPKQNIIPEAPLFPDLESKLLETIEALAGLQRKTQQKIIAARKELVHLVLETLFIVVKTRGQQASMALPTSNHAHSRKGNYGYGSYHTVLLLIEAMKQLGWVEVIPGGKTREGENLVSTLIPKGELLDRLAAQPLVWRRMPPPKGSESIFLRTRSRAIDLSCISKPPSNKNYNIPFVENNQTRHIAKRIYQLNEFISHHAIGLNLDWYEMETLHIRMAGYKSWIHWATSRVEPSFKPLREPKPLNLLEVFLFRIFSRGSFDKGGRHYGPYYQNIIKEYRSALTIDGEPTSEQDYSCLHLRILYAFAGVPLPEGDLFDIWLPKDGISPNRSNPEYEQKRKLIKQLINAWINDEYDTYDLDPEDYKTLGLPRDKILYRILRKHPILRAYKGCGMGVEFQCIDAEIAERVMFKLMEQGIVCLPIFDSFRVQVRHEAKLREAMIAAYQEVLGASPEISHPEPPKIPDEMPLYPTVFEDTEGNHYKLIDQTYVDNYRNTHPHHVYLQGFWESAGNKSSSHISIPLGE